MRSDLAGRDLGTDSNRLPGRLAARPAGTRAAAPGARWFADEATRTALPGRSVPPWAVVSAGLSPVLLTGSWIIADALQPHSYSPVKDTISGLAGQGGTDPWLMTAALFLVGGCYLATAAGLAGLRAPARGLLVIAGVCSAGIAASPEPGGGGPGAVHLAWAGLSAAAIAAWPAFASRAARPGQAVFSGPATVAVTVVSLGLACWVLAETHGGNDLGLAERVATATQTAWPFVVAVTLRRGSGETPTSPAPGCRRQRDGAGTSTPPSPALRCGSR